MSWRKMYPYAWLGALMMLLCLPPLDAKTLGIESIDAYSRFPDVSITISVFGADPAAVINAEDLQIFEDGSPVQGKVQVRRIDAKRQNLYIIISIDSSRSISRKHLKRIKAAAKEIVHRSESGDAIAVYRFDDRVSRLSDYSSSKKETIANIETIARRGRSTLLYEAIYEAVNHFRRVDLGNKKCIVFTDGKDEGSTVSADEVARFARESRTPIYFICLAPSNTLTAMARIARRTGGMLIYSSDGKDISDMYRTILSGIQNRFHILYQSRLNPDGAIHSIEVRLQREDCHGKDDRAVRLPLRMDKMFIEMFDHPFIPLALAAALLIIVGGIAVLAVILIRERRMLLEQYAMIGDIVEKIKNGTLSVSEGRRSGEILRDGREQPLPQAWIMVKAGPQEGKRFTLQATEITIGRSARNTIAIADPYLSEHHAAIKGFDGAYHLFDLISEGGTYLNGKKLLRPKVLHDWDEIAVGKTIIIFRSPSGRY